MKNIAISGASGFVGKQLSDFFEEHGYNIITINRNALQNSIMHPLIHTSKQDIFIPPHYDTFCN